MIDDQKQIIVSFPPIIIELRNGHVIIGRFVIASVGGKAESKDRSSLTIVFLLDFFIVGFHIWDLKIESFLNYIGFYYFEFFGILEQSHFTFVLDQRIL